MAYFKNFPIIKYTSENVDSTMRNIMVRGALRENIKDALVQTLYINEGDRADYISHLLFKDSKYDYLFYLLNDIVDPYYEWYLTQKQMDEFLYNKYGANTEAPKYYKLKTQDYYVDEIIIKYGGAPNNDVKYSNTDIIIISGGIEHAIANITTASNGTIISTTITQKGHGITNPTIDIYDLNGNISIGRGAEIAPIIINTENSSNVVHINVDTYNMLSNNAKLDYESVTNKQYEHSENDKRRYLNAVLPEIGYKIDKQLSQMLSGITINNLK